MQFIPSTVLGLFDSSQRTYKIPVYQRAYSWEKPNWKTFLEDLQEQIKGHNNYFFGNLLLEVILKNKEYEIIDGQQRITTLVIFISSIINILEKRKKKSTLSDFEPTIKRNIYLKNNGNIKFRPVEYDKACFDAIIIDNDADFITTTMSQKRIKDAKKYFEDELELLSSELILEILEKIEDTELTMIELEGKKDSALMFELENNRGKDLTNMEKIKSYFMYQMYVYSKPEDINNNIENISDIFKSIYLTINDLKGLDEDSILYYHNNAYINGFSYRTLDDVKNKFKKNTNKVEWIKMYIKELHTTFLNIKIFETSTNLYTERLKKIEIPAYIYPFIIRAYKYLRNDNKKLENMFEKLEVIIFRAKLINSRANIQERLNTILKKFEGNVQEFLEQVITKLNESWYWGDDNTNNHLNGSMYGNKMLNYILWEYEDSIQNKGYSIKNMFIKDEQIEHISPQTPTNGANIKSGYDVDKNNQYSEEFKKSKLNSIGNLMLISGSHNASIGNKAFQDKLATYKQNPLLNQQAEIEDFSKEYKGYSIWKEESINQRNNKIVTFALKRWDLK